MAATSLGCLHLVLADVVVFADVIAIFASIITGSVDILSIVV